MDEADSNLIHEIRTEVDAGLARIAERLEKLHTLIDDKSKQQAELLEAICDAIKQPLKNEHP